MNTSTESLRTIDGATLMSMPLRPPNFVVDTLLSQGGKILAGTVAGGHGGKGRIRLESSSEPGDHALPLSGRFPASHPEPVV